MSSREFTEWQAYLNRSPSGERMMDLRFAMLQATITNRHRNPKEEPKAYTYKDFMPDFEPPKPETAEQRGERLRREAHRLVPPTPPERKVIRVLKK